MIYNKVRGRMGSNPKELQKRIRKLIGRDNENRQRQMTDEYLQNYIANTSNCNKQTLSKEFGYIRLHDRKIKKNGSNTSYIFPCFRDTAVFIDYVFPSESLLHIEDEDSSQEYVRHEVENCIQTLKDELDLRVE